MKENNNYELIKFKDGEFELDVNVSPNEDTVWLSKEDLALLFERDRSVIARHINNIFEEGELSRMTSCAKNAHELNGQTHYTKYFIVSVERSLLSHQ